MKLAARAGLDNSAVGKFETNTRNLPEAKIVAIKTALEAAGVEFPEGEPPRLKSAPPK